MDGVCTHAHAQAHTQGSPKAAAHWARQKGCECRPAHPAHSLRPHPPQLQVQGLEVDLLGGERQVLALCCCVALQQVAAAWG